MKLSIRWALIFGFLCLIWGTFVVTTGSSYFTSQKVLNQHARDVMKNIADLAMEQSQNHIAHAHGATALTKRLLTSRVVDANNGLESLEQYFLEQLAVYRQFAGIYVGKPNGDFYYVSRNAARSPDGFRTKIIRHIDGARDVTLVWRDNKFNTVAREKDPRDSYDPRKRPWYRKAMADKSIVWTDPYIFYTSRKPGITIAGPAFNSDGGIEGIVGVDIEIDQLSTFIANLNIGKNGQAFMINDNGDVVAFPDLEKIRVKGSSSSDAYRLVKIHELDDALSRSAFEAVGLQRGANGRFALEASRFASFELDGRSHHVMFTPFSIRQWPWIIGVHLPEDDYLGDLKQNRRFNFMLMLVISAIATLAGLRFAHSIIRPIANLEKEAQSVKNDDLTTRFDLQSGYAEIKETAATFRHMKEAVRDSQKKYRSIFENMQDVYFEILPSGEILELSPSIEKVSRYSRKELIGRNFFEIQVQPDRMAQLNRLLRETGKVEDYEIEMVEKDGGQAFYSLNCILTADDDPNLPKIIGSMRNTTGRKKVEKELQAYREHLEELVASRTEALAAANQKLTAEIEHRMETEVSLIEKEEKYRNILESIEEGYFETDLEGRLIFLNDATTRILGWSRQELQGMSFRRYTDETTTEALKSVFKVVLQSGVPRKAVHFQVIRKDGTRRDIELSISLRYGADGNPAGFRGIGRDVTNRLAAESERKLLEQQLNNIQRLEAVGTLAGGIAHDFNNLLMGIQANASLLHNDPDITAMQYDKVQGIQQCIESGAQLTRQLLGFARGGKYNVKATNLNAIVRDTAMMFGRTKKEIQIEGCYQEDIWTVKADRSQIEQVLVNLYLNAWQSMEQGGRIQIRTGNEVLDDPFVKPHGVQAGRFVHIAVSDTGCGMDQEVQQHVFEPFFTTKARGRGTGLGLASAFGILKNHNGFITFESRAGQGSTFHIYLPATDEQPIEEQAPHTGPKAGSGTILLVDDEPYIRMACQPMLAELGYTVMTADGGLEALKVFEDNLEAIDLVILDMIMPDMDGQETFTRLRQIDPAIKVILCSGYSHEEMAEDILAKGCNGFIQKPYDLNEISEKINEVLDGNAK